MWAILFALHIQPRFLSKMILEIIVRYSLYSKKFASKDSLQYKRQEPNIITYKRKNFMFIITNGVGFFKIQ